MVEGLLAALLDLVDAASEEGRGQLAVYRVSERLMSERLMSEPNEHKLCFTVEKGGYVPHVAVSSYPSLPWLEPSSPGYGSTAVVAERATPTSSSCSCCPRLVSLRSFSSSFCRVISHLLPSPSPSLLPPPRPPSLTLIQRASHRKTDDNDAIACENKKIL